MPSSAWIRSSTAAKTLLLQPGDLPQAAGLQDHPGQGRPSPQVQGLAQEPRGLGQVAIGQRRPTLAGQPLKAEKVQLSGERSTR